MPAVLLIAYSSLQMIDNKSDAIEHNIACAHNPVHLFTLLPMHVGCVAFRFKERSIHISLIDKNETYFQTLLYKSWATHSLSTVY